jgi:organic radical activating enzyme
MTKLRLLITEECNRSCPGCCNKDWDLKSLKVCRDYTPYKEIFLTGGEPLILGPTKIKFLINRIRNKSLPGTKIYLYTAAVEDAFEIPHLLRYLDGVTLTLHTQDDADNAQELMAFLGFWDQHTCSPVGDKSLRLNVFKGIDISQLSLNNWKVKKNITWIKNCPLPIDEVFMRCEEFNAKEVVS